MNIIANELPLRKSRTICLPFEEHKYEKIIQKAVSFRAYVDRMIEAFPELFPAEVVNGYQMKDHYHSKKIDIDIRRIKINGTSYSVRPSFVMPYMTGLVKEMEKAMFLRKFAVPFWALAYVFGRDPMYWYRAEQAIGRNSIVGTTIADPEKISDHLCGDEKHSWLQGERVYITTTVGDECILGSSIARSSGEYDLAIAYNDFKQEAQIANPDYSPQTVNLDGWEPTQKAWKLLFPRVSIILCFLHIFIGIRDRIKKKHKTLYQYIATRLWKCYHAKRGQCFSQRVRHFCEWAENSSVPSVILEKLRKLRTNRSAYTIAYDFPRAHRTSNMLDRVMQRMDRFLFSMQYFHGTKQSAIYTIRGWSLIFNFAPWNPYTTRKNGYSSPAEQLNRSRYHDCWLQNLYISASLGGYRKPPQNPL